MSWPAAIARALALWALAQVGGACAPNPRAAPPRDAGAAPGDAGARGQVGAAAAGARAAAATAADAGVPVVAGGVAGGVANGAAGGAAGAGGAVLLAAQQAAGYRVDPAAAKAGGTVRIFVRWPDIPAARRLSPGEGGCGAPRPPSAEVDELWGIAEVAVALELGHGKAPDDAPAPRLGATPCALAPRVVVATPGRALVVASGASASTHLRIERRAWKGLGHAGASAGVTEVALPWLGHAVSVVAPAAETWLVTPQGGAHPEPALVLWAPHPYVAVTDGDGLAVFRDVPAGEHAVRAYLPARGGARAHTFTGKVRMEPGGAAEVVLVP